VDVTVPEFFDLWPKPHAIQSCDAVVDEGCEGVGCFGVRDGVLAIGVQAAPPDAAAAVRLGPARKQASTIDRKTA
jgi:hypothetical protein